MCAKESTVISTLQSRLLAAALTLCLAPNFAHAAGTNPNRASPLETKVFTNAGSTNPQNLLENASLATSKSVTLTLDRLYSGLIVSVFFTRSAATAITMTQTIYQDAKTGGVLQSRSIVSGASTLDDFSDAKAVSGNKNFVVLLGVAGYQAVTLTFTGTGAAAGDTISVQATAVVGQ
jgi:hypothetical protein